MGGLIVGAVLIVALLRGCVATSYLIPSSGMENSLYQGERIFVGKWSYGLRLPFMGWWGYHRWGNTPAGKNEIVVFNNPGNRKEPVISRREVFIGRVTGTPGDTLLVDSFFTVAPSEQFAPDRKFLYAYPRDKERSLDSLLSALSIPRQALMGQDSARNIRSFSRVVPAKGRVVRVYPWNRTLLCNTLVLHEHKKAYIQNDTLYVDGKPTWHCRFTKDYYWVTSDNTANISDSRLFGFVPEDHLIGRAALIWYSRDKGRIGKKVR